ncbi:hypothetical protein BJ170DRAFT_319204 [Xylariales sp. AK1849]|nr:hypothetical protein BJ170DRAFT_319204 [Xylariales sp. AK1849]
MKREMDLGRVKETFCISLSSPGWRFSFPIVICLERYFMTDGECGWQRLPIRVIASDARTRGWTTAKPAKQRLMDLKTRPVRYLNAALFSWYERLGMIATSSRAETMPRIAANTHVHQFVSDYADLVAHTCLIILVRDISRCASSQTSLDERKIPSLGPCHHTERRNSLGTCSPGRATRWEHSRLAEWSSPWSNMVWSSAALREGC